jgi:HEAT repeat protein
MGDIPTEQVNREIIRVMVLDPRPEDLPLLTEALNQPYLEVNNRAAILRVLGRMGDASAIPVIEQSLGLQTEPAYAQLAQEVIAAIRERDAKA